MEFRPRLLTSSKYLFTHLCDRYRLVKMCSTAHVVVFGRIDAQDTVIDDATTVQSSRFLYPRYRGYRFSLLDRGRFFFTIAITAECTSPGGFGKTGSRFDNILNLVLKPLDSCGGLLGFRHVFRFRFRLCGGRGDAFGLFGVGVRRRCGRMSGGGSRGSSFLLRWLSSPFVITLFGFFDWR